MTLKLPITLARRPGWEDEPDSYISPVIELEIVSVPHASQTGEISATKAKTIRALLDTGADLLAVDEGLLLEIGATSLGLSQATIKTSHDERRHIEYFVHLNVFNAESSVQLPVKVTALPLNDGKRAYEAILGMQLIRQGRLSIDPKGESFFELDL